MVKELILRSECYDNEDFVNKINECVRALNNLESLITSHNKQSTPCLCRCGLPAKHHLCDGCFEGAVGCG